MLNTHCGTNGYQSPEQLGLLPSCFGTGKPYTTAVDIWAFGVVVHELLTSEIPFLDKYQPTESTYPRNTGTSLDMQLLHQYCTGDPFPVEKLQQNCVSEEGIDFVKSLMVVNPTNRVSAREALASPWLVGIAESRNPGATGALFDDGAPVDAGSYNPGGDISLGGRHSDKMRHTPPSEDDANMVLPPDLKPRTALQLAVETGDMDSVTHLLDRGADPNINVVSSCGLKACTALQRAVESGDIDFVRLLLDRGADPNKSTTCYPQTPFQMAMEGGNIKMTILLLERGANARI